MKRWLAAGACALALPSSAAPVQNTVVRDAIVAADNTYAIAYLACDIQAWQHLLGDDLTFVHRDGSTEGKAGQLVRIKSCSMESATSHVETVRVYDDNAAIVTGVIKGNARGRGGFHLVYTRTYVRRGGAWQIVAHQSTDAPGNPR